MLRVLYEGGACPLAAVFGGPDEDIKAGREESLRFMEGSEYGLAVEGGLIGLLPFLIRVEE